MNPRTTAATVLALTLLASLPIWLPSAYCPKRHHRPRRHPSPSRRPSTTLARSRVTSQPCRPRGPTTPPPHGAGLRALPQPKGVFDDQPSYSPDGTRIYFERYTAATNDNAIWSMTTDGTRARRMLGPFPNGFVTDPNISPDGRTMSFQGWDGTVTGSPPNLEPAQGLFTATLGTGRVSQIWPFTSDQTTDTGWAPNGGRIAVTENANHRVATQSANIATMRPDGSGQERLTHFRDPQTNAYFGSYSPDGQSLVYRLEDHGRYGLYRMHPDGSHQQAIIPLSTLRPALIDWGTQPEDQN